MKKVKVLIPLFLLSLLFLYQNCGETNLSPIEPVELPSIASGVEAVLCSDDNATIPYFISDFYVLNLTSTHDLGNLKADSDMDGVSDDREDVLNGFDALDPRSQGKLDAKCLADGTCTACNDTSPVGIGLLACEVSSIDEDKDGLLTYIEMKNNLSHQSSDQGLNTDNDSSLNINEIKDGFDPNFNSENNDFFKTRYSRPIIDNDSCESVQDQYSFRLNNIALVETREFTDPLPGLFDLSHEENENVILIYYVSKPEVLGNPHKIWGAVLKIKSVGEESLSLNPDDFVLIGEYLP